MDFSIFKTLKSFTQLKKRFQALVVFLLFYVVMWLWASSSISMPEGEKTIDLVIPKGASTAQTANRIDKAADRSATLTQIWALLTFRYGRLHAGVYEIREGMSLHDVLSMLVKGRQAMRRVTFIEGWNFKQMRKAMSMAPNIKSDTLEWSDAQIMSRLGFDGMHPEGRFFPDTYVYTKNSSDLSIYAQAFKAMARELEKAWQAADADGQLRNADQLLILASIVEKETGDPRDRGKVSSVFHNRLRDDMLLQTDPTVIYGMGESYTGRIRRVDLRTDTPYNTYTRKGLPPTPIAMPGRAALMAAAKPETTDYLYFVARGDGSSEFSETLDAHNRAVQKFILDK